MDKITATELRSNIYNIIDRVIATGKPCEIVRGDKRVYLTADALPAHAGSEDLVAPHKNNDLFERMAKLPKREAWLDKDEELLNYKVWDEEEWTREWDEFFGESDAGS